MGKLRPRGNRMQRLICVGLRSEMNKNIRKKTVIQKEDDRQLNTNSIKMNKKIEKEDIINIVIFLFFILFGGMTMYVYPIFGIIIIIFGFLINVLIGVTLLISFGIIIQILTMIFG